MIIFGLCPNTNVIRISFTAVESQILNTVNILAQELYLIQYLHLFSFHRFSELETSQL